MQKNYSIGLDIGTASVGYAVIDDNFNIIKKGNKQKSLWGVRLFDMATTAVDRRNFRSTRRRYDRRRERIRLLQDEFREEINKVDPTFFQKLKTSNISPDDIKNKKIPLTNYDKKEIFSNLKREVIYQNKRMISCVDNKYPTIYHLRKKLIINKEKEDIRLIYLAIHHIIKYRGNFNYNMDEFNINKINVQEKLEEVLNTIFEICTDIYNQEPSIDNINLKELENAFYIPNKNDKKKAITKELTTQFHNKVSKEIASLLAGSSANLENLFAKNIENVKKIDFTDINIDKEIDKLQSELPEEFEVINAFKELYDMISLKQLFKDQDSASISNLMVANYNKQKKDLHLIKDLIRPYQSDFKRLFKDKIKDNKEELSVYTKYIRNQLTYTEFTNEIKKVLEKITAKENQEQIKKILDSIENGAFLPRIADTQNGKFPYQLNLAELKIILENQGQYYPFLLEKVKGEYKIVKLLKFRIPYYVGPLIENENHPFAWMVRKSKEKITPYNFEEVVDIRKSAKNFIYKMLGKCSYLLDEYAIPNNSLLYSKFKVLNELKQIKINDKEIDLAFQHKIYKEFFLKNKGSLTDKKFQNYLRTTNEISMYVDLDSADIRIDGYSADLKFANNMDSYIDFFGDNGIFKDTNLTIDDAEKIIELITVFEDKEILKEEITELYPNLLPKMNTILTKNYKGWSNLSRKLLETKYYYDEESNTFKSIMDLMWETTDNFMQIINNPQYNFQEFIQEENNQEEITKLDYSLVNDLATSPATKRGIYQAIKVVEDIVTYMGYEPKNISIEMSRSDEKKVRKDDRKKRLLNIYDQNKTEIKNYQELKDKLKNVEKIDKEKLFLYFLQEGKSLYSGTSIIFEDLYTDKYEVDHILPQTLIKDDSIDNKALVLREENQIKRDNLVLPREFQKQSVWWNHLKKIELMSSKKYNNLIRTDFTDKDIEDFINRQLVETRQITKHVANILKSLYKNTNVIYLKSNISSNYRQRFKLYKYRDLNDYHHAHDAYLAITLGIYQAKYLKRTLNKSAFSKLVQKLINEKRYNELKYGYVINSIDENYLKIDEKTGEVLFNTKEFIEKIANTLYRNDILISKKTFINTGAFYKETIYKATSNKSLINIKENLDPKIYGGYTSCQYSYMILVKYQKKNKEEKALIGIPVILTKKKNLKEEINNYIIKELNCDNYIIEKDRIPFNIEIIYKNQKCCITGCGTKSAEVINNIEFKLTKEEQIKYKNLLNFIFNQRIPSYKNNFEGKKYWLEIFDKQIIELYDLILDKIELFYPLYSNELEKFKLLKSLNKFQNLNLQVNNDDKTSISKVEVIQEIFKMLKCNSTNANLDKIKLHDKKMSSRIGRQSGINIKSGTLIFKSPAGLKESRYEF